MQSSAEQQIPFAAVGMTSVELSGKPMSQHSEIGTRLRGTSLNAGMYLHPADDGLFLARRMQGETSRTVPKSDDALTRYGIRGVVIAKPEAGYTRSRGY